MCSTRGSRAPDCAFIEHSLWSVNGAAKMVPVLGNILPPGLRNICRAIM